MKFQRRTVITTVSLLILLLLPGCQAELSDDNRDDIPGGGKDTLVCTIDGDLADIDGEGVETKTSLSTSYVPLWSKGDAISVLTSEGINEGFTLISGSETSTGSFNGVLPAGNSFFAWYPYNSSTSVSSSKLHFKQAQAQTCSEANFAPDANFMLSSFDAGTSTVAFKNVFGILKLQLSGTANVAKIKLTSKNSSDMLWGDFYLYLNGDQTTDAQILTAANGSNVATLVFPTPVKLSSSSSKAFYFVLPPGSLSSGFTMTVYDDSGTQVFSKSTTKAQTIKRSKTRIMPAVSGVNRPATATVKPEPFTWTAVNNLKRTGSADKTVIDPQTSGYPKAKTDKYVGMFYFVWHDRSSTSTIYNNQSILGSGNYEYNPSISYKTAAGSGTDHYWGEPYLGYYKTTDSWVIRKHAQMLVDAGVDFIAFDVTNDIFYETEILNLLKVYKEMRDEGNKTPQITFLVYHSYPMIDAVNKLYNSFYSKTTYKDLWFQWEGKPLMLANKNDKSGTKLSSSQITTLQNYFTFRTSWFLWNSNTQTAEDKGDPWWVDGVDKWPWGCCYTANTTKDGMKAGKHGGVNECCAVMPATHPISNLGRSYPVGQGITYKSGSYTKTPEKGIYFKSQFKAANDLDPKVLFFTGWNEWIAGHLAKGVLDFNYMCGVSADKGIFVDQFNHEYSRDIEPMNGNYGDNYYYYLADFIRQFKGVNTLPVYSGSNAIVIDGKFTDWVQVESCYADDKGDIKWRGYDKNTTSVSGNGGKTYTNQTGRNDLRYCSVTTDGINLYFYVEAEGELTGYSTGAKGLNLYIKTGASSNWEGFNYKLEPTSSTKGTLSKCTGGWAWESVSTAISLSASGKCLELAIPLTSLGLTNPDSFSIDFKWVDNVDLSATGGIQQCMRDGDSAPNGRFCYRYIYKN